MKITTDSHTDHHLSPNQVAFVAEQIADKQAFVLQTIELPPELGTVPCGLYGPLMGDAPVLNDDPDVTFAERPPRKYSSKMIARPFRPTRLITIIGGEHNGEFILYTAFGGPSAPREPGDPGLEGNVEGQAASSAFWNEHALAMGAK